MKWYLDPISSLLSLWESNRCLISSHINKMRECRLLVSTKRPEKHKQRARLQMSKQAIGFEIWGEVCSDDPNSLHTYAMQRNKAPKAFSNFPSRNEAMADAQQNVSLSSQPDEKAACF